VDLSHAAEALGLEQVAVLRALDAGGLTPSAAAELTATRTGFTDAVVSFTTLAPPVWRSWWDDATAGADVLAARQMQDAVARAGVGEALRLDADRWTRAMSARVDLVHRVETRADAANLSTVPICGVALFGGLGWNRPVLGGGGGGVGAGVGSAAAGSGPPS
jgi:hypothetical protein